MSHQGPRFRQTGGGSLPQAWIVRWAPCFRRAPLHTRRRRNPVQAASRRTRNPLFVELTDSERLWTEVVWPRVGLRVGLALCTNGLLQQRPAVAVVVSSRPCARRPTQPRR
jgi:hypothetical protein